MKGVGLSRMFYTLEFELNVNFIFNTSHVITISSKEYKKMFPDELNVPETIHGFEIPKRKERDSPFGYLLIDSTFELEEYDSLNEGAAKIRPQLLAIHGILTFLTNKMFISFQNFSSSFFMIKNHIKYSAKSPLLIFEGTNCSSDLDKIIKAISSSNYEKQVLIYTLFERWRKALYLEVESEESYIHLDEAVLAYIHILEVLSDEFKKNLDAKIKLKRKELITEIIDWVTNSQIKNPKKINTLLNLINANQVTLKSKILQMLIDLNLYNLKSEAIILRFIEHRNSIAHGRKDIYQDKVVFPLKPFFSLIKDIDENPETIKVLSARAISSYLGLAAWNSEWKETLLMEFTPLQLVKEFIESKRYMSISNNDFRKGKINGIIPLTISYYHLKNRISFQEMENVLSDIFLTSKSNKEICISLFNAAIPLSDSSSIELALKAREIIRKVDENDWGYYSNPRDFLKDYEYHGKYLKWFATWLTER